MNQRSSPFACEYEEVRDKAEALLACCRPLLTGREILMCENVIAWEGEDEFDDGDEEEEDDGQRTHYGLSLDRFEVGESEVNKFRSLEIQFSREIAGWLAERDRAASRRAVEAHQRIQQRELQLI